MPALRVTGDADHLADRCIGESPIAADCDGCLTDTGVSGDRIGRPAGQQPAADLQDPPPAQRDVHGLAADERQAPLRRQVEHAVRKPCELGVAGAACKNRAIGLSA